jgi:hypothetical protein
VRPDDTSTPAPPSAWTLAAELAPMTDVWRKLLEEHVPTPVGRCRACTQGGTGIPTLRWPCGPHKIAEAAAHYYYNMGHSSTA